MPELSPPPSINDLRAQGIYGLTARFGALDLSTLLLYTIKYAPNSALQWLAWQFDILDPEWQLLANPAGESIAGLTDIGGLTDVETLDSPGSEAGASDWDSWRALLQQAIPLHRQRGTVGSIVTALSSLGWPGATLQEGQNSWGGTSWPANEGWAVFRVRINLAAGDVPPTVAEFSAIVAAANFFKPARCLLDSVWIVFPGTSDMLTPAPRTSAGLFTMLEPAPKTAFSLVFAPLSTVYQHVPEYNAEYQHAGFTYRNQPIGPTIGASTFDGTPVEGEK